MNYKMKSDAVVKKFQEERMTLKTLFSKYGSDKDFLNDGTIEYKPKRWVAHQFADFYADFFMNIKNEVKNVLEVGLGTNHLDHPSNMGKDGVPGASVRAWRDYFPNANIYGADNDKRILFEEERIKTFYIDSLDGDVIDEALSKLGVEFDIIIDDSLHTQEAAMNLFNHAYPYCKGLYFIEDMPHRVIPNIRKILSPHLLTWWLPSNHDSIICVRRERKPERRFTPVIVTTNNRPQIYKDYEAIGFNNFEVHSAERFMGQPNWTYPFVHINQTGDVGCCFGHAFAVKNRFGRGIIATLEDDAIPVDNFEQRVNEEILDNLPEDWAVCIIGWNKNFPPVEFVNPYIKTCHHFWGTLGCLWNTDSPNCRQIVEAMINGDVWVAGAGIDVNIAPYATQYNLAGVYTSTLRYIYAKPSTTLVHNDFRKRRAISIDESIVLPDGMEIVKGDTYQIVSNKLNVHSIDGRLPK
jgi:hypothetical protein